MGEFILILFLGSTQSVTVLPTREVCERVAERAYAMADPKTLREYDCVPVQKEQPKEKK